MAFEVVPAIDVSLGKVVRLTQGERARTTVYRDDPVATAVHWEEFGAPRLHVVDIDGAFDGRPRNRAPIADIVAAVGIPVQVAGGIRDMASAESWLAAGADRIVVGTQVLRDPGFAKQLTDAFGEQVIVALDSRDRTIRVEGWTQDSGLDLVETATRLTAEGVRRFLCTDIARDGMLTGSNKELLAEVASAANVPVVASGGVSTTDDLRALSRVRGIEGAVVGKAFYNGNLGIEEALAAVR